MEASCEGWVGGEVEGQGQRKFSNEDCKFGNYPRRSELKLED